MDAAKNERDDVENIPVTTKLPAKSTVFVCITLLAMVNMPPVENDNAAVTYINDSVTVFVALEHELSTKEISFPVMFNEDDPAKLMAPIIRKQLAVTDPIVIFV